MPTTSDRFVDVLRVFAIAAIVGQHWLFPQLTYENGILTAANSLAGPGGWAVAWVGQVLPLIFFAGGAAAAMSLRHRSTVSWIAGGARRLVVPALPLAVGWLTIPRLLVAVGVPAQPVQLASELVGRLLWFLAVYAVMVSLTPILVWLHERWRGRELIALAAAAICVDIVGFTVQDGTGWLGYANVVLVWGAIYQAGITYAEAGPIRRRTALALSAAGLGATVMAITVGPYASSAIGVPGEPLSTITAPSGVLLALAAGQGGLALALRDALTRWAGHRPVRAALDRASARLLTVLLWHIPALVVVAGLVVVGFGHATGEPFSTDWRTDAPMWLAALTVVLAGFVRVFGRFEFRHTRATPLAAPCLAQLDAPGAPLGAPPAQLATPLATHVTTPVAAGVGLPSAETNRAAGLVRSTQTGRLEA